MLRPDNRVPGGRLARKLIIDTRGFGLIDTLFSLLIMVILFMAFLDLFGFYASKMKLRDVCSETLTIMKFENGFDSNTRAMLDNFARSQGLNPALITVTATPKTVQRGETVYIKAAMPYVSRSLKPLGVSELRYNAVVELYGLAHSFIR